MHFLLFNLLTRGSDICDPEWGKCHMGRQHAYCLGTFHEDSIEQARRPASDRQIHQADNVRETFFYTCGGHIRNHYHHMNTCIM